MWHEEADDPKADRKRRRAQEKVARKKQRIAHHTQWTEVRRQRREEQECSRRLRERRPTRDSTAAAERDLGNSSYSGRSDVVPPGVRGKQPVRQAPIKAAAVRVKASKRVPKVRSSAPGKTQRTTPGDVEHRGVAATTSSATVDERPAGPAAAVGVKRTRDAHDPQVLDRVRRMCNTLTMANVVPLAQELTRMFAEGEFSRASVIGAFAHIAAQQCTSGFALHTATSALPYAGMIRALQLVHGSGVGAEVIEHLCQRLHAHLLMAPEDQEGLETSCANGAMLIAHLYILHAVDSVLITSLCRYLLQRMGESVAAGGASVIAATALSLLRTCGDKLRKEVPAELGAITMELRGLQKQPQQESGRLTVLLSLLSEVMSSAGGSKRAKRSATEEAAPVEDMLDGLGALLPFKDASPRTARRVVVSSNVLAGIPWRVMVRDDKVGRWYAGGVDETGGRPATAGRGGDGGSDSDSDGDPESEKAARIKRMRLEAAALAGQRLNTENKREVFRCVTATADDVECFNMLMCRDPNGARLHDTAAVLLQCCYQEKVYNPFYAQVIHRLCSAVKAFHKTLQFALWDHFKVIRIERADVIGYINLSALLVYLMEERLYTLSVLRGMDLSSTNKTMGLFVRVLLTRLIAQLAPARLTELFFGGDGFTAHDTKLDTQELRSALQQCIERYILDEEAAAKWMPLMYDVIVCGTPFDATVGELGPETFMKRAAIARKALKSGIA